MSSLKVRWGILSTGKIAATFARALVRSETGELVAVGSRSREPAERFANEHGAPRAHATYQALLADAEVDAVYIATPHPTRSGASPPRARRSTFCVRSHWQ